HLTHVAQRGRIAKGEAQLRLQAFLASQCRGPLRVAEVVGDRLLAEDVLARFERGPGQLEMCGTRCADVDRVDIGAAEQLIGVGGRRRDVEHGRGFARSIELGIGNGDESAAGIAAEAWEMGAAGPRPGAEYAYTNDGRCSHRIVRRLRATRATI